MAEAFNPAEKVKEFLGELSANPSLPSVKAVVEKLGALPGAAQLNSLPGVAQLKGIEVQVLKVQRELLKAQLQFLDQMIETLEAAPAEAPSFAPKTAPRAKKATKSGKITIQ